MRVAIIGGSGLTGRALAAVLGEMATLALDGQRAVPERLLERGYEFRFPEVEAVLRNLLDEKGE